MFKVGQVVELKRGFKTPTCKKGVCSGTGRNYAEYKILSCKKVNCVAFNMGTLMVQTLRMENCVLTSSSPVGGSISFDEMVSLKSIK
jgi:hypothetical protein